MKIFRYLLVIALLCLFSSAVCRADVSFATMEGIAAKVGKKMIVMEKFNKAVDLALKEITKDQAVPDTDVSSLEPFGGGMDNVTLVKRTVLDQLIDEIIIEEGARENGITVSQAQIKDKVEELKKKFPSSLDFHRSIAERGMTVEDLKRDIERQLIVEGMQELFASKATVPDEEIEDFYNRNIPLFVQAKRIEISQIRVSERSLADMIYTSLKSGADFKDSARTYSEDDATKAGGGYVGYVESGQLKPELEEIAFSLSSGEASPVIKAEDGYYILLVSDRELTKDVPLKQAKENIRSFLLAEKGSSELSKWTRSQRKSTKMIINSKLKGLIESEQSFRYFEGLQGSS
jgi:foldase protein PrsA